MLTTRTLDRVDDFRDRLRDLEGRIARCGRMASKLERQGHAKAAASTRIAAAGYEAVADSIRFELARIAEQN